MTRGHMFQLEMIFNKVPDLGGYPKMTGTQRAFQLDLDWNACVSSCGPGQKIF